jgi:streptogramin lyase
MMSHRLVGLLATASLAAACAQAQPTAPSTVVRIDAPFTALLTAGSLGRDGRVWFALADAGPSPEIGFIDDAGSVQIISLSATERGYFISDIAVDQNHHVWVALQCEPGTSGCPFGGYESFWPGQASAHVISPIAKDARPMGIALAPDGSAWITESKSNAVIHVGGRRPKPFPLRNADAQPTDIAVDATGAVRFIENAANSVGTIDRRGRLVESPLPQRNSKISGFAIAVDGRVWYAEFDAGRIAAVDRGGHVVEYPVPTQGAQPISVTLDDRGTVWFVEYGAAKLGRIGRDGKVSEVDLPDELGRPIDVIAARPDMLYVFGLRTSWFDIAKSWSVARIPEATAIP